MDCIVHGVTKSQKQLSDFHFHFQRTRRILGNLRGICTFLGGRGITASQTKDIRTFFLIYILFKYILSSL